MRSWIWGNTLLTAGLLWVAGSRALARRYPLSWGGPNIGAGFITILAYFAIAAGLGLVVGELIAARRGEPDLATPRRRSRAGMWAPAGLSAAAAVVCGAVVIAPPAIGGSGRVGAVGVTVDSAGPVLVLVVCERTVDTVTLVGPNGGSVPNEKYAVLAAPSGGIGTTTVLPLDHLPAGWGGGPVFLPLARQPTRLVIAAAQGDQTYLSQVAFTAVDLAALTPGWVRLSAERTVPSEDVETSVCA